MRVDPGPEAVSASPGPAPGGVSGPGFPTSPPGGFRDGSISSGAPATNSQLSYIEKVVFFGQFYAG